MADLESRVYDEECFEEDRRFVRCRKECMGAEVWGVGTVTAAIIVCYLFSGNPEDFTYVWGYPAWYVAATLIMAAGALGGIVFAAEIMACPKLTAHDSGEE